LVNAAIADLLICVSSCGKLDKNIIPRAEARVKHCTLKSDDNSAGSFSGQLFGQVFTPAVPQ